MRWMVLLLLLLSAIAGLGVMSIKRIPYSYYAHWMQGEKWNKYYEIEGFRKLYLSSPRLDDVDPYKEKFQELWKVFPLNNTLIPLPVRHPLFRTFPIVEFREKYPAPHVGISIASSNRREISRIYTLPVNFFRDHLLDQEIFKLPYVRNRLLRVPLDKLWPDIFSKKIQVEPKSVDEMLYDLYLVHLRTKYIPKQARRYGLNQNGKQVLIELVSSNKDYKVELVMSQRSGNIYSYILRTAINNKESKELRDKFLGSVDFAPADPAVARILYTEFKQLGFARQVDQEGVQYLFCAWSQDTGNQDLLKELIFYMERERGTSKRIQPFYRFALKKYGKSFTTKAVFDDNDDPEVVLSRQIEMEDRDKKMEVEREKSKGPAPVDLTPDERMNLYLKEAKELKKKNETKEMTVH
jgi:hypothetical protein